MAKKVELKKPDFLEGYDPADPASLKKVEASVLREFPLFYLEMTPTPEKFIRIKNKRGKTPRTRLFEAGNQSGKTTIGVAEDIAHAMGFRPWLEKDDPDYRVQVRVPNNGMVGCEVAGQTLAQNIEPKFLEMIPDLCQPVIQRYSDGSIKTLTLTYDYFGKPCGSTIHFRSYVQPADSYEGVVLDWIHWDEPPPRPILNAAERGKMKTNAPSWLTMTPLKEPYIYDLFSLHAFNNGGENEDIAIFRCSTWENCQDWCRDCNLAIPENDPDLLEPGSRRPKSRCPNCRKVLGFMPRAGIDNYLQKITDPDEREAREEGKWKHLSGLVYKMLDRDVHEIEDFRIPNNWMRIESVDPADAKPTRWIFGAVSPEDITINGKPANRIYWYAHLLVDGSINDIAHKVKVKRAEHDYREAKMVILDAKFGARTTKTNEGESSWEEKLREAGINNIVLSHSSPGDISLGHKAVKEYLKPHYSVVKGKEFPGMLFMKQGCGGSKGPLTSMLNYMWDEDTDKPKEEYKDFPDTIRYVALEQPVYHAPEPEFDSRFVAAILDRQNNQREQANPLYIGLAIKA